MKYWFDTEFLEDGRTIDLISIGIVAEDGREYYAVNGDFDRYRVFTMEDPWLRVNVMPYVENWIKTPYAQIREEVTQFLSWPAVEPEIWAYYADYDWVALCQLFGRMIDLPKFMPKFCRDLKQLHAETSAKEPYRLLYQTENEHHALYDARWTRDAYLALVKEISDRAAARDTALRLQFLSGVSPEP